jgi:hypothetical protein
MAKRSGKEMPAGVSSFPITPREVLASVEDRDADAASRDTFSARPVAGYYHLPKRGFF